MNLRPSTSIYLDTRREKLDNTYPVKLRVTFQRKRKYYSILDKSLTENDFNKVMGDKPRGKYKDIRTELEDIKHEADELLKKIKVFSFETFEKEFLVKSEQTDNVFSLFESYIKELNSEGRIGTAASYSYSLKSFKDFYSGNKLPFERVTYEFLNRYERFMIKAGYSITTIGIYLRSFRTILNVARRKGLTNNYPFGKGKNLYQIKNPPARKMALTTLELQTIFNYKPIENSSEDYFFSLWKFSYLCSGMNVKDLCNLKYGNIERDKIFYKREKTKRTNFNGKEIIIPITKEIKNIIEKWGQKPVKPDTFIFPILKPKLTPEQTQANIKQAVKQINKYIKRVSKVLEIEINVSTYTARHSFATQLMRHGAPTEFISKQLGHASMDTTNSYLENFEERQLLEWQEKVTDFGI